MGLSGDALAEELFRRGLARGWSVSNELCRAQAHIIDRYHVDIDMDCFQNSCLTLRDEDGRTVGFYEVSSDKGYARSQQPNVTEIIVPVEEGMILGWVSDDQVIDAGQPWFSFNTKSLNPMPKVFSFAQPCPHMSVHGGWWNVEESVWECFGCGRAINDYKIGSGK